MGHHSLYYAQAVYIKKQEDYDFISPCSRFSFVSGSRIYCYTIASFITSIPCCAHTIEISLQPLPIHQAIFGCFIVYSPADIYYGTKYSRCIVITGQFSCFFLGAYYFGSPQKLMTLARTDFFSRPFCHEADTNAAPSPSKHIVCFSSVWPQVTSRNISILAR